VEKLKWSSDLDTGVKVIDSQHRRIVDYINDLQDAKDSLNKDAIRNVIDELVDYTVSHFSFEESLMEQAGYPFIGPHKKIHELFIKKVSSFVERFNQGEDVVDDILVMLRKWLINHIKNEDGDYVEIVSRYTEKSTKGSSGWLSRSLGRFFH
jgi:hemerythrin